MREFYRGTQYTVNCVVTNGMHKRRKPHRHPQPDIQHRDTIKRMQIAAPLPQTLIRDHVDLKSPTAHLSYVSTGVYKEQYGNFRT
jgi:hypothetical protein